MHIEDPRQVVRSEFTLEVESFQRRQRLPSIVDGKKQGKRRGAVQESGEGRGENLVEVRELRSAGDDGSWEGILIQQDAGFTGAVRKNVPRSGGISSTLFRPKSLPFTVSLCVLTIFAPPFPVASTPTQTASSRAERRSR